MDFGNIFLKSLQKMFWNMLNFVSWTQLIDLHVNWVIHAKLIL